MAILATQKLITTLENRRRRKKSEARWKLSTGKALGQVREVLKAIFKMLSAILGSFSLSDYLLPVPSIFCDKQTMCCRSQSLAFCSASFCSASRLSSYIIIITCYYPYLLTGQKLAHLVHSLKNKTSTSILKTDFFESFFHTYGRKRARTFRFREVISRKPFEIF